MREHDHAKEALEAIDRELERPPVTIEEALQEAVAAGRMTQEEAAECLEAYLGAFLKREDDQ